MERNSNPVNIPLPKDFVKRVIQQFGEKEGGELLAALDKDPRVSISKKCQEPLWDDEENISYAENGVFLRERPSFTLDPRFHAGLYYPQEASSMFIFSIAQKINELKSVDCALDLCAAPGGKSILLHKALKQANVIVSNEVSAKRNVILCENMIKWGDARSIVTQSPLAKIGGNASWDLVLLDAPCSGEGMFRKDHDAREEWSIQQVESCSKLQMELLQESARLTKPGGFLIYSTCTFAPQENEEQCAVFLQSEDWESWSDYELPEGAIWKNEEAFVGVQFLPHNGRGEGFFCAVFRKKQNSISDASKDHSYVNSVWKQLPTVIEKELSKWVKGEVRECRMDTTGNIHMMSFNQDILDKLDRPRQVGIPIGTWIKNKFIPAQGLLTSGLVSEAVKRIECNQEQAIHLLRGEDWRVELDLENDWYAATWQGIPFAWLKRVGNRFSNHYPKDWRIRRL